jgi:hypothetical protein
VLPTVEERPLRTEIGGADDAEREEQDRERHHDEYA